jgi:hypothetical protein
MIETTNRGYKKPELTDNADLTVFVGDNMDMIDDDISNIINNAYTELVSDPALTVDDDSDGEADALFFMIDSGSPTFSIDGGQKIELSDGDLCSIGPIVSSGSYPDNVYYSGEEGDCFFVSFEYKTSGTLGSHQAMIGAVDSGWFPVKFVGYEFVEQTNYKEASILIRLPENSAKVAFSLEFASSASETIWIKNLHFRKLHLAYKELANNADAIGDRTYIEENYVTNDESITDSIDAL